MASPRYVFWNDLNMLLISLLNVSKKIIFINSEIVYLCIRDTVCHFEIKLIACGFQPLVLLFLPLIG